MIVDNPNRPTNPIFLDAIARGDKEETDTIRAIAIRIMADGVEALDWPKDPAELDWPTAIDLAVLELMKGRGVAFVEALAEEDIQSAIDACWDPWEVDDLEVYYLNLVEQIKHG